jgi:peroxiredoxin
LNRDIVSPSDKKIKKFNLVGKIYTGGKNMALKIGDMAPDFTLNSHTGASIQLSDYRGKNVVMAFFPLAWTPV